MSEDVARKAIDWLFKASGETHEIRLTLFGGEPLLNRSVFEFVMQYSSALAEASGKRIYYSMTTNGTLLDDMSIGYILKNNFGLMLSLDGPPEVHDAQCPRHADGSGSFEAASAGAKALLKRRSVTVRCTMTNQAPPKLDLIRFFEEFGFTRIVLGPVRNPINPTPWDCEQATLDELERQEVEEIIPWLFDQFKQGRIHRYFPYASAITYQSARPRTTPKEFHCGACRGTSTVAADGTLYPCHRFVGMSGFITGHIDSGPDLDRIKRFWRDYDAVVGNTCNRCWAQLQCWRPCPWALARADGGFNKPDASDCDKIRRYFERATYVHHHLQMDYPELYRKMMRVNDKGGHNAVKENTP